MAAQKDLFDDSTMTFGEHLEVLRSHLWKAIVGLVIGCSAAFFFSNYIILAVQQPVVRVMQEKFGGGQAVVNDVQRAVEDRSFWESAKSWLRAKFERTPTEEPAAPEPADTPDPALQIQFDVREIARKLHETAPDSYPEVPEGAQPAFVAVSLADTPFGRLIHDMRQESLIPRTDSPDEAFMIYLKVSLVVGFVIASPWIFYQLWLFVAAGLYPHERKYVYMYLPFSIGLFLVGALFCFFIVIPQVLGFLFEFNKWLNLRPEIKISEWITFALVVSLMFGLSFQLPLVMVLLTKISIVDVRVYKEKRRWAILIIAILSMVLTPSDPVSMLLMMGPLIALYELGILLCGAGVATPSPFGSPAT